MLEQVRSDPLDEASVEENYYYNKRNAIQQHVTGNYKNRIGIT